MNKKLSVLIAQELLAYRSILQEAVTGTGFARVRFSASTGQTTLERLKQDQLDVVLLSMHIPEKYHLETLAVIKKEYPGIHVIMVCDGDRINAELTVEALQLGALDFIVVQPLGGPDLNMAKCRNKLQGLFTQIMTSYYTGVSSSLEAARGEPLQAANPLRQAVTRKKVMTGADLILIASSTGGPAVLKHIFQHISAKVATPILIVQHMPPEFTGKLAKSLNKYSPLKISEALENEPVKPGRVLLAPGGMHLTVTRQNANIFTALQDSPPVNGVKPAADVLFSTVANVYAGKKVLAVILTGMGSDGMAGVRELKKTCECFCLVQGEESCVVYGMPGSVVQAGLADEIQELSLLPDRISAMAAGRCHQW